ncbi:ATP-binding protein [Vibrio artabrorum]|uniref:histidine kinase n=1 Tax=Vibrio artabrorum TaxID=446374 RepID=A0ABT8CJ56_9VIBR|nr:sensor histidine kinase [Vibrio artabrorum]MDN3701767.1 sensor histidine kinase [Vibrio artabrorum]
MKFKIRILVIQSLVAVLIAIFCVFTTLGAIDSVLSNDRMHESRNLAMVLAVNSVVVQATKQKDTRALDSFFRHATHIQSDYVVITTEDGTRLYHTDPAKEIGKVQGESFQRVMRGEVVTLYHTGLSGLGIKTRAPIYDNHEIVGMVSVGYLESHVHSLATQYLVQTIMLAVVLLLSMLLFSWMFSNYVQQQLSGMTPAQIARAFRLRIGILNSVAEGVIAVDTSGKIMVINKSAINILGIEKLRESLFDSHVSEHCYPSDLFIPQAEEEVSETTVNINGETLLASRTIMRDEQKIIGYVVSFRPRNTPAMLQLMVRQVAKERDAMRVVTHEYANNMAVVSGMLEMQMYEQALKFIHKENNVLQQDLSQITGHFHPMVAALILSKKHRSSELGYKLTIVEGSSLRLNNSPLTADEVATILGNLLDNAYEAIAKTHRKEGEIELFVTDVGKEIVIEVYDNGIGISDDKKDKIFRDRFTSKEEDAAMHGVGLALIHGLVTRAGGDIVVEDNEPNGTVIGLFVPKLENESDK